VQCIAFGKSNKELDKAATLGGNAIAEERDSPQYKETQRYREAQRVRKDEVERTGEFVDEVSIRDGGIDSRVPEAKGIKGGDSDVLEQFVKNRFSDNHVGWNQAGKWLVVQILVDSSIGGNTAVLTI
jgi:hypothetical protein